MPFLGQPNGFIFLRERGHLCSYVDRNFTFKIVRYKLCIKQFSESRLCRWVVNIVYIVVTAFLFVSVFYFSSLSSLGVYKLKGLWTKALGAVKEGGWKGFGGLNIGN